MPDIEQKEPRQINYPQSLLQIVLKTQPWEAEHALNLQSQMREQGVPCRVTNANQAIVTLTTGENHVSIAELMLKYNARLYLQLAEMNWGNFGTVVCSGLGRTLEAFYTSASGALDQDAYEKLFALFSLRQNEAERCLLIFATTEGQVGVYSPSLIVDETTNSIVPRLVRVTDRTAILAPAISHAKNRARNPAGLWPFCSNARESRQAWPRRLIEDPDDRMLPR
jgi:hypothetical protein